VIWRSLVLEGGELSAFVPSQPQSAANSVAKNAIGREADHPTGTMKVNAYHSSHA